MSTDLSNQINRLPWKVKNTAIRWKFRRSRRSVSRVLSSQHNCDGWPFIWGVRYRTPRRNLPGQRRGNPPANLHSHAVSIRFCSRWGLPCRRRCRQRGALLPHPFTLASSEDEAVCFLWHFPWGHPRRPLAGTVFPWSPDFPPSGGFPHCQRATIQPSEPLVQSV